MVAKNPGKDQSTFDLSSRAIKAAREKREKDQRDTEINRQRQFDENMRDLIQSLVSRFGIPPEVLDNCQVYEFESNEYFSPVLPLITIGDLMFTSGPAEYGRMQPRLVVECEVCNVKKVPVPMKTLAELGQWLEGDHSGKLNLWPDGIICMDCYTKREEESMQNWTITEPVPTVDKQDLVSVLQEMHRQFHKQEYISNGH